MEDIMDEPSQFGLNAALEQFWKGLQDVSTNPENAASRKVAMQRAAHLAESFNYMDKQMKTIQGNLGNEINVATNRINSLLKQIAAINKQVQEVEPNGHVPNDLYDARDVLIDELNNYIPVSIKRVPSGGNASAVAEGSLTVVIKPFGTDKEIELVNGRDFATLEVNGTVADPSGSKQINGNDLSNVFSSIQVSGLGTPETITYGELEPGKGKLLSLINSYGYDSPGGPKGYYVETLADLNKLAVKFAEAFNKMHKEGYDLTGVKNDIDFFTTEDGSPITAGNIKVNDVFIKDPSKLAASDAANEEGNGKFALELANLQSKSQADLDGATFNSFYQGMIGKLGTDGEEAYRLNMTSEKLLVTLSGNRASVSSVSLDEEMTNMITFQQAYNANARMITVVDETLDKIINGMGRVGL